jgi:DNA-binding GntR family transcriptional regulator
MCVHGNSALFDLPQPKRISLSESVADTIAEAIATRIIAPGERIVETSLVEKLGVSRVPIREALKVLHAQGIIAGGGHRGYRVAAFDAGVTQQIMEVRLSLETFMLRDAIENWREGVGTPAVLEDSIEQMRQSAKAGSLRNSMIADLEFHRMIRTAADNPIVGTLWDTIARHVMIVFNFERFRDEDLDAIPRQHEEFRDWIVAEVAKPSTPFGQIQEALEDHMLLIARKKKSGTVSISR